MLPSLTNYSTFLVREMAALTLVILLALSVSHCVSARPSLPPPATTTYGGDGPTGSSLYLAAAATIDTVNATHWDIPLSLARQIRIAATTNSIPLSIAFPLVHAESRFNPNAVSWAGATGLTQLMPATASLHCKLPYQALFVPLLNLNCGFSYLSMLYTRLGDWRLALIAYNRGPTKLSRELRLNLPHGTSEAYARSILSQATL
jgi:soluble lytic murein transglycosylase-like protein